MGSGTVPGRARLLTTLWYPSLNAGPRRDAARPDIVVLHYTAMTSAEAACDWLCNTESQVSAHYVISEAGIVWQLVDEADRAWHAGAGRWGAVTDVNSRSIGIELANTGTQPFSEPQMARLETLLSNILQRWQIPPERVIAHSDLAPTRKFDPGPRFDWRRLALRDLSVWPQLSTSGDFARDAQIFGYGPQSDGDILLAAFRSRFRPWATGPLDDTDRALMADLANRYPNPDRPAI
ncbi:N-acetylmuramoyl-L-alanine amidase [Puniceibacterium sp. IMCC21224]|uniref:N-acetylmuramoyl-L-alanine amidase n=1 Tax=Puniceibacterium sp. IMCC21224 TaxID=1618204 RepID=UPI0009E1F3BE|nr:N-acetylmuramoyl-L-alanine amidase [Puniceibacterium sp. IMCC21224]